MLYYVLSQGALQLPQHEDLDLPLYLEKSDFFECFNLVNGKKYENIHTSVSCLCENWPIFKVDLRRPKINKFYVQSYI